ncbi:MAG: amino acid adenylation domain-containing protein [Anaerolineales bacterium]
MVINTISSHAVKTPNALAVQCGTEQATYSELLARANKLASYLRQSGAGTGTLIGICLPRSVEMVVGILATLIAGGAYVPIDPSYPKERISFMLEDAEVSLVITESTLLHIFSKHNARLVCIDREADEIAKQPADHPMRDVPPESLAYVLYTSGSTGKPKGVMVSRQSLSEFARVTQSVLDIDKADVYLQTASINYALSVRQMMVPLACGACIVVASAEDTRDPVALFELIKHRRVTLMDVVPSLWRTCINRLLALPHHERNALLDNHVRRIVSVGEPLLFDIPYDWRVKLGHRARMVNIFGQTETTGVVAAYDVEPEKIGNCDGVVPIGRSIADTRLYILDSTFRPVSAGEIGELYVSSLCLALGYLNRPELSAEKFMPNPFNDGISERLYRTGDLARQREDGVIEHLGRGDHQVKIRGQRLELGEVEAEIRKFPKVQQCVVVAKGKSPDERYLAAFIIASDAVSVKELKTFMRRHVPEYMIPAAYQFLDAFPLTPNGKLDRLALQESTTPGDIDSDLSSTDQPRTDIESRMAEIWKSLLKRGTIGIHDDFFDIGGHSFLAVRLFARIEDEFGIRLPITTLFHAATIAQLAEVIGQRDRADVTWSPLVPIRTRGERPPFFGIHGHEGGVLFWNPLLEYLPEDQPFFALQAQGVDGIQPAFKKIEDMASLYIREIRKVQPHGPYYLGGYSLGGEIALDVSQQLLRQGEQVKLLVMFDTRNPKNRANRAARDANRVSTPGDWWHKMGGHFRRLSALNTRGKVAYVTHDLSYRMERIWIYAVVGMFRALKRRLPDNLLLNYLRKSHTQALLAYSPEWYPGRITLFRASETLSQESDNTSQGWDTFAGGGLEVFHFNATHNLLDDQYANDVASQLIACIDRA